MVYVLICAPPSAVLLGSCAGLEMSYASVNICLVALVVRSEFVWCLGK